MSNENSLVNIGDLAKPVTTLIEKIADATGVLYEPRRIRKRAKAEADAELIKAETHIEITDLQRRALARFRKETREYRRHYRRSNTFAKRKFYS